MEQRTVTSFGLDWVSRQVSCQEYQVVTTDREGKLGSLYGLDVSA